MSREFTRELLRGGEEAIGNMIGRTESIELEFKTKEQPENHMVSKTDKRNLGKVLSGFSNAYGGLVIFGISTKKIDQQDVAHELRPIADIARFKSEVDGRLGELLRPANPSIETHAVPSSADPNRGYLLIDIGESDYRPHMSMAPDHQKYFRRSVEGTLTMDHSLIRDLMMAPKEAQIKPKWRISHQSTQGAKLKTMIGGGLDLHLKNVGSAMAAMPYARILIDPHLTHKDVNSAALSTGRPDGSIAFYGTRDAVIHPSDEVHFCKFQVTFLVDKDAIFAAIKNEDWITLVAPQHWAFGRSRLGHGELEGEFESLNINISFGAENAQKKDETFHFSKTCLIKLALETILTPNTIDKSIMDVLAAVEKVIEVQSGS